MGDDGNQTDKRMLDAQQEHWQPVGTSFYPEIIPPEEGHPTTADFEVVNIGDERGKGLRARVHRWTRSRFHQPCICTIGGSVDYSCTVASPMWLLTWPRWRHGRQGAYKLATTSPLITPRQKTCLAVILPVTAEAPAVAVG